jgi:hypothetical protein
MVPTQTQTLTPEPTSSLVLLPKKDYNFDALAEEIFELSVFIASLGDEYDDKKNTFTNMTVSGWYDHGYNAVLTRATKRPWGQ